MTFMPSRAQKSQSPVGSSPDLDLMSKLPQSMNSMTGHNRLSARVLIWTWPTDGLNMSTMQIGSQSPVGSSPDLDGLLWKPTENQ